jgi:hypothetical protein
LYFFRFGRGGRDIERQTGGDDRRPHRAFKRSSEVAPRIMLASDHFLADTGCRLSTS